MMPPNLLFEAVANKNSVNLTEIMTKSNTD
jgi:hypothetical protein